MVLRAPLSLSLKILSAFVMLVNYSTAAVPKDIVLTRDAIVRFVATVPPMKAIVALEGATAAQDLKASSNPLLGLLKAIGATKVPLKAQAIVSAEGFSSFKEWRDTAKAIGLAYARVSGQQKAELSKEKIEKDKQKVQDALAKLNFLTPDQKDKLKSKIDKGAEDLGKEPPPGNIALVDQMRPDIEAAFK